MRIAVLHQFYRSSSASGENLSVRDEVSALRSRGHEVELLAWDSDQITSPAAKARAARQAVWSHAGLDRIGAMVDSFQPQIALLENLFPSHSPAAIRLLSRRRVPTVAAVRNFRMQCAAGTFFRDGRECRDCVGSLLNEPAVRHGCYGDSRAASVAMATSLTLHRRTWPLIDHFLPISTYMADYLGSMGFPPGRMTIRHNYVADVEPATRPGRGFFYAGRLTSDKGFENLVEAWMRSGLNRSSSLRVAGSGPGEAAVEAAGPDSNIELLGLVPHETVIDEMRSAAVTVVPSTWAEPFGRVAIEAASLGRPAIATRSGGLVDIVVDGDTGWLCDATEAGLSDALVAARDATEAHRRGEAARSRFLDKFTEKHSVDQLEEVLSRFALRGSA